MSCLAYDVVIVGGGPAGAATALRLRAHDPALSVLLVEASGYERQRIGESLPPPVQPLIEQLGLWPRFLAETHVEAFGTLSTWGTANLGGDDFILSLFGRGWHLDRRRFDVMLAQEAERQGVCVQLHTRLVQAERAGAGWQLRLQRAAQTSRVEARFVVDASGPRAIVARRTGIRRVLDDRLIAIYAYFHRLQLPSRDTRMLLEPVELGWWYTTDVPNAGAVAVLMTDRAIIRRHELNQRQPWLAALASTTHVQPRLEGANCLSGPTLTTANSGCLEAVTGEGWLAVGDAASSFDPLSGQGVVKALQGGMIAAYAVSDHLRGRRDALPRYQGLVTREFEAYLETRASFYQQEQRWPHAPFWRQRQSRITLAPTQYLGWVDRPENRRVVARLKMHLAFTELHHLCTLCRVPKAAHEIVAAFKCTTLVSDRRIVLALQYLLEQGVLYEV